MEITDVAAYVVPGSERAGAWSHRKPLVFVRLETRSGIIGWGEAYALTHRSEIIASFINVLARHVIGRSVFDTRLLVHDLANGFGEQQLGMDFSAAVSAIEIAAWDAAGRCLDVPVYRLLGGACHRSLPLYANLFTLRERTPGELAEEAVRQKARGFCAAKLYPFRRGETLDQALDTVAEVRAAVGPDFGLAIDVWRSSDRSRIRRIWDALSPCGPLWLEDPFDPVFRNSLQDVRRYIGSPLVCGETMAGKQAFLDLCAAGAVDWINPDVCACGGVLEFRDIAAIADVHHCKVTPHNYNSMTIGLAATAHAAIGVTNLGPTEYFPAFEDDLDDCCHDRLIPEDGELTLPERPGLGVSLDDDAMERFRVAR